MRVVVTGRLRQREYEPADSGKRTVYEVDANDVGPSLRRAAEELIRDCGARPAICEEIIRAADALGRHLWHAQARIEAVPHDLGETYESVYSLIRHGGVMPRHGRWITGTDLAT
jgi:hypothetical protein